MKRVILISCWVILFAAMLFSSVAAESEATLKLHAVVHKDVEVINEQGEKTSKQVEALNVIPGDEVIYTIYYSHIGNEPAENVFITNPIPEQLVYQDGTALGGNTVITFSVDGGQTFNTPENLKVKNTEGKMIQAKPTDYTHIRWTMAKSVLPKDEGFVSFRALLE